MQPKYKQTPRNVLLELASQGKKKCLYCGEIKPFESFHKSKANTTTGRHGRCIQCMRNYMHEYNKTPTRQQRNREINNKHYKKLVAEGRPYWKRMPRRMMRARGAVHDAVRRGKIPSAQSFPCFYKSNECGGKMHYHHHNGYTKAHKLDVIPVCAYHHSIVENHKRKTPYR